MDVIPALDRIWSLKCCTLHPEGAAWPNRQTHQHPNQNSNSAQIKRAIFSSCFFDNEVKKLQHPPQGHFICVSVCKLQECTEFQCKKNARSWTSIPVVETTRRKNCSHSWRISGRHPTERWRTALLSGSCFPAHLKVVNCCHIMHMRNYWCPNVRTCESVSMERPYSRARMKHCLCEYSNVKDSGRSPTNDCPCVCGENPARNTKKSKVGDVQLQRQLPFLKTSTATPSAACVPFHNVFMDPSCPR